jgi:hypothetical protein
MTCKVIGTTSITRDALTGISELLYMLNRGEVICKPKSSCPPPYPIGVAA